MNQSTYRPCRSAWGIHRCEANAGHEGDHEKHNGAGGLFRWPADASPSSVSVVDEDRLTRRNSQHLDDWRFR